MRPTRFIQRADGVSERMLGFMAHLRGNGMAVSTAECRHSLLALESIDVLDSNQVRLACKAVCAHNSQDFQQFDELFDAYWRNAGRERAGVATVQQRNASRINRPSRKK